LCRERVGKPASSGGEGLEAEAQAGPDIVDALVLLGKAGVRDVIDKRRYLDDRIDPVAQLQLLAEQNVGAEALPVGLRGDDLAVIGGAAEENPGAEPVTGLEDVVRQHPTPLCAEIELVGVMAAVDLG